MLARQVPAPATTGGRNQHGKRDRDDYDSGMWCDRCQSTAHNEDSEPYCWKKHPEKEAVWRAANPEKSAQMDARKVLREAKKACRGRGAYRGRGGRGNYAGHASTTAQSATATATAPAAPQPKGANGEF